MKVRETKKAKKNKFAEVKENEKIQDAESILGGLNSNAFYAGGIRVKQPI